MAIYNKVCRSCGKGFQGGPRAWYCPECRHERQKENNRRYKKTGSQRPLGSKDICQNCGGVYTVEGGNQMYCPDCQPIMHKKIDCKQSLDYYNKHKNVINRKRNEVPMKRCIMCGKDFPRKGRALTCSEECRKEYKRGTARLIYAPRFRKEKKNDD